MEVQMPFTMDLESMPDTPNRAAEKYGPVVLAGELGPENDPNAEKPNFVPVMVTEGKAPTEWLKAENGQPNKFQTLGVGKPRDVTLYPFYKLHDKRFSVYWDFFTSDQWKKREAEYQAEMENPNDSKPSPPTSFNRAKCNPSATITCRESRPARATFRDSNGATRQAAGVLVRDGGGRKGPPGPVGHLLGR